jgi:hypothetical protein
VKCRCGSNSAFRQHVSARLLNPREQTFPTAIGLDSKRSPHERQRNAGSYLCQLTRIALRSIRATLAQHVVEVPVLDSRAAPNSDGFSLVERCRFADICRYWARIAERVRPKQLPTGRGLKRYVKATTGLRALLQ